MNLVIFEGCDGVGKGLLLRAFREHTSYAHVEMDRGHVSRLAYARYFKRREQVETATRRRELAACREFILSNDALVVYLSASKEVAERRVKARGEDPARGPDHAAVSAIFDSLLEELDLGQRLLRIDTSADPDLEALAKQVADRIKIISRKRKK